MARAPDPLDARRDTGRGFDLEHKIDSAHVDAQLKGRRRDQAANDSGLELVLNQKALLACDGAVMGEHELFPGQLVDPRREPFRKAARVDENDG